MKSVIASHLVLTTASTDADPDVVISRTADRLHPVSHKALAEHVGDIRLVEPDDIAELPIPPLPLLRATSPVPDVAEEITRLDSHCAQLSDLFASDGPVGRKIEFLLQEISRETNTIGSKSPDIEVTRAIVEMKAELERLREQVQNVL